MEVTGQCRKEFVAMLRCMLDSLLTAERESEKFQSYTAGKSQAKRLREIVGALVWPLMKALTPVVGGDGQPVEGRGYVEGLAYRVNADYLAEYNHEESESPYNLMAKQFRAPTNQGWWTVFDEMGLDDEESTGVGNGEMVGIFLGKRCEHKKKRALAEGDGIGLTGRDRLREKYNMLNERYWEVVDDFHDVREDLNDADVKIQRLRVKLERSRAKVRELRERLLMFKNTSHT